MQRRSPLLLLPFLFIACGSEQEVDLPAEIAAISARSVVPDATDASSVVTSFLTAVGANDEEGIKQHLTEDARNAFGQDGGFSMSGQRTQGFEVGAASIEDGGARVPATVDVEGKQEHFDMLLRVEDQSWRIHGMEVPFGESSWTISFEGAADDMATAMATELAEGMTEAFEGAFENAMTDWENGGSPAEIAAEHARFEALQRTDESAFQKSWSVTVDPQGRSAASLFEELLAGSEFSVEPGAFGDELARTPAVTLEGVSRAQAIEEVAAAVELVPVYQDGNDAWGEGAVLRFERGPRRVPATHVGPFAVTFTVDEEAPNTTGALTIALRAFGVDAAVLASNAEMGEVLSIGGVTGNGTTLLTDEGMSYWGSPVISGNAFSYSLHLELRGLLRGVEDLTFEGEVRFVLPGEMAQARFDGPGAQSVGAWQVSCESFGEQSRFRVTGEGEQEGVVVRFAPTDAAGGQLGILSQSSMAWGERVDADLTTPAEPAAVALKVYETSELRLPIRVTGIPLARFSEQPVALEPLSFRGNTPVRVTFREFGDRSNPDFPEVVLDIASLANKDALNAQVTFEYLDANNVLLKDFPHTLTGPFDFDGQGPLAPAGAESEQSTTAFFMPENTVSVHVRVDEVTFLDGSDWKREQ